MVRQRNLSLAIMMFVNPVIILVLFQNCSGVPSGARDIASMLTGSAQAQKISDPNHDEKWLCRGFKLTCQR